MILLRSFLILALLSLLSCTPDKTALPGTEARTGVGTVEIYKHDGSIQCQPSSEVPLSVMAQELTRNGIEIISSRRSHDGLMRPAVCGAGTGSINVYEISGTHLEQALRFGFHQCAKLATEGQC